MNLLIKAGIDAGARPALLHLLCPPRRRPDRDRRRRRQPRAIGHVVRREHGAETGNAEAEAFTKGFREKHEFDFSAAGFRTIFESLQAAVNKAGSVDATKVAYAMEGLTIKDFLGFDTTMRKDDHQIITEYFVGMFKKGVKYDAERPASAGRRQRRSSQGHRPAQHLQDEASEGLTSRRPLPDGERAWSYRGRTMEVFVVSLLNGLVYGMLLFMLASGLTLIFSMMGVLNFAHASVYMLGAYFAYTISRFDRLLAGAGHRAAAVRR